MMDNMKTDKMLLAALILIFAGITVWCSWWQIHVNFQEVTVTLIGALIGIIRAETKS